MYLVKKINTYTSTRHIALINLDTLSEDICFDDSALVSRENFGFMQVGEEYNCKIVLFGEAVGNQTADSVVCEVVRQVMIGTRHLIEVKVKDDTYYVPSFLVSDYIANGSFFYSYSRKDLAQVDDVIHNDYLI